MTEHRYQLVVQFPQDAFANFDAVVAFEDELISVLADRHEVDGHDIGSGEVNFFVLTDDPAAALSQITEARGDQLRQPLVRAAARPIDSEEYAILWPAGDERPFTVR